MRYWELAGPELASMKILILSAKTYDFDRRRAKEMGADGYITKPFDKRELVARINAIVRRAKGHSQSIIKTGKLTLINQASAVGNGPCHVNVDKTGKMAALANYGSGSVASTPAGISCPSACAKDFDANTTVTLTATAGAGYSFTGWNGTGISCGTARNFMRTLNPSDSIIQI